ncbi:glycosyl transferase [Thermogemmatispora aurantia]|uniref:Glycosyl transferase n=1 Tax=Thermogemmatispora aurantia TaxID=2045279 RepID=A0A5J4K4K3_9CHLR|nr:glycosyltransferase family 2 protein [Thermogemmatispora aurantia]GER82423.1 glycosyl transferase [Thermogemmatispora aurantia]
MRVSVVVPVYNEEATVARLLEALARLPLDLEVIIVDDASFDHTWDILQTLRQQPPFDRYRYVRHSTNQGKGTALRTGFSYVTGDLVLIQDADLEYDPQDIPRLVERWTTAGQPLAAVYGCRNLSQQPWLTRWGNRFLTVITNLLYGCRLSDMETCYKLMPRAVVQALPLQGRRFEIEPEITIYLVQAGLTILEVPIRYTPRQAKKLSPWRDGWPALLMLLRRRLAKPFHLPAALTCQQTASTDDQTDQTRGLSEVIQ